MTWDPREHSSTTATGAQPGKPPAPAPAPGRKTRVDGERSASRPMFGDRMPQWESLGYEDLLLDALTMGDVPMAEFENYLLQLTEQDLRALLARLTAVPPPADDRLATAFYQTIGAPDRKRITNKIAQTTKNYADDRMWSELAPGEGSTAVKLITRIDAFDGVYLRSQPFGAKNGALLPFGTLVAVSRKTDKGWYYVTVLPDEPVEGAPAVASPVGAGGFIESYHAASNMPEPSARLHKVQPGQLLKDIAAMYYKHSFAWGHDARVFVQAIYHANKDRDAVFRQRADLSVNQDALSTKSLDEALELWGQARVVGGQALWMPSHAFVGMLKASGAINNASISKQVWDATAGAMAEAWSFIKYAAGFFVGILEGAWGALVDLFKGVVDLLKMVWTVVKGLFNDFAEIRELAKQISAAWKNRDAVIQQIATEFMDKWENPNDFARGNFQGEFLGYVMMTAFIIGVTFGAGMAAAGAGRFGSFIRLIQFADKAGSLGTYVGKLTRKIKLPKGLLDRTRKVFGNGTKLHAPDPPKGHLPHGELPDGHVPHVEGPHVDVPHVEAPHVHRAPQKNQGGPHVDPTSSHPDAGAAPHAHLDKLAKITDEPVSKWKKLVKAIDKGKKGLPVGRQLKNVDEGHELLARLARGDASALHSLGVVDVPPGYNTMGREWAVVEGKNGVFLYAGRYADVEMPAGVRVHAHSHPDPHASAPMDAHQKPTVDLPVAHEGATFGELLADPAALSRSGLAPSVADIHAISDGGAHVIYTRYAHRGAGKIANPIAGEAAPRVALHLSGTKVARYDPVRKEYFYQVSVELRDAVGAKLWSGEMYAQWWALTRSGTLHLKRPPHLDRPLPKGWVVP